MSVDSASQVLREARHSLVAFACRLEWLQSVKDSRTISSWQRAGKPVPPPPVIKQRIVRAYASEIRASTFVETGTYFGDMDEAVKEQFKTIISIELSETLWKQAVRRFRAYPHIQILLGDSGDVLPGILEDITSPALFWLDGHYSGGVTAKGSSDTPVVKEVMTILRHKVKGHTILIDDARCFNGTGDYPTQDEMKDLVARNSVGYAFMVSNDVIRIHPLGEVRSEF